ncbi:MAG: DeoR family transcriptional regulator, partial [Candidatus Microbacterium stercoravium]
ASRRILLADHTKFDKRALHAMQPLADFDAVIVDAATDARHLDEMRQMGVNVIVAPRSRAGA